MMIYDMNKNLLEGNCEVMIPYFSEPPRPFNITNFSTSNQSNVKELEPIVKLMTGLYIYLLFNLLYLVFKDNLNRIKQNNEYIEEEVSEEHYDDTDDEDDDDEDDDDEDYDYEEEFEPEDVVKTSKRQKENSAYQRRKSLRSYNK